MFSKEEVIQHLNKERIRNVNLMNFMESYPIHSIERVGDSFLVRGRSDQDWVYISSASEEEFQSLVHSLKDEDQYFAIIEDWMMPYLLKDKELVWQLSCSKLYFPEEIELPKNKCKIEKLASHEAQYIYDHYTYQQYTTIEYIAERIEKDIALGIYEEDRLVAWILTHDDGAVGLLHVLEEYRKKGYGQELTIAMIRQLREEGRIPFVHIEDDNEKSMNLALKAGFVKDRLIHWFQRK